MCKKLILLLLILQNAVFVSAQRIGSSPEYVKELTALWKGERSADGRPKVSELVLDRLQYNTLEQIWGYLLGKGYRNQVEKNWTVLKTGQTMVG
ncbi:MAG TPA: RraA family protein, partial [Daejeonella sp.]|nr:RraA family protein [Daejeonella sp.]